MINDIILTDEQELLIKYALEGKNVLVDACIGSGKTTAIQQLCSRYSSDKKILYLTYNKLLKIDAKSKIKLKNVFVSSYHGFAYMILKRTGKLPSVQELIQEFNKRDLNIPNYDVLIIDEYQDIDQELSELLIKIKSRNPDIQIIAVGDMEQKIYDKTTLNVREFINCFLEKYDSLEFTKCFRLNASHAEMLGRIWNKKIIGVNDNCKIKRLSVDEVILYLSKINPSDVLCLGARTGDMADVLNALEEKYPKKYNKKTVYASISDNDSSGNIKPNEKAAIFTTFDSSKGLERKVCVVFDYTESYWEVRVNKPLQSYYILRNIFCVAASRGKNEIIFVNNNDSFLSESTIATPTKDKSNFKDVNISEMFDFKYKEDIEECVSFLKIKCISKGGKVIKIKNNDELIDLSPCIGIFQEANYFNKYDIEKELDLFFKINSDLKFLYKDEIKNDSLDKKILFLIALKTRQNRYINQVDVPYIKKEEIKELADRLASIFKRNENVQVGCKIGFKDKHKKILFSAIGFADVVKGDCVFELKYVSELSHEHFLQCASYMIGLGIKKGILWNIRDNTLFEIRIPNKKKLLDCIAKTISKRFLDKYY